MKKYPFGVQAHAHSIEFYHNHLFNTMAAMESGEIPMDKARYDKIHNLYYGDLMDLYEAMFDSRDGRVVYLSGKQIGLAKKIIVWASEQRAKSLIEAGKTEYLQYC